MTKMKDKNIFDHYSPAITKEEWVIVRDAVKKAEHKAFLNGRKTPGYTLPHNTLMDALRNVIVRDTKYHEYMIRSDLRDGFLKWGSDRFEDLEPVHITIGLTKDQWNRLKAFKAFLNEVLPP